MQQALQQKLMELAKPALITKWLGMLLVVITLWILAKLIWLWVDAFTADYQLPNFSPQPRNNANQQVTQVSVNGIVQKHLFGDETAKPVEEPVQEVVAQETSLNLKLRGIYASDNEKKANAIIELAGGKQEVYFIGDKINGANNTSLHQVQPIKVILNRSGRLESLTLEQKEAGIVLSSRDQFEDRLERSIEDSGRAQKSVVDNPRVRKELNEIRQKLQTDPASLKDMMRWEPVMDNGQLQGVRISPGKSRRLFYELKLRRNDVVTSINGTPLSDPSQLLALQQEMATASEISLNVLRNGQPQDITIKLEEDK